MRLLSNIYRREAAAKQEKSNSGECVFQGSVLGVGSRNPRNPVTLKLAKCFCVKLATKNTSWIKSWELMCPTKPRTHVLIVLYVDLALIC